MSETKPKRGAGERGERGHGRGVDGGGVGGLSRRRLLGGALAGTLAAVLLGGEQARGRRGPDRWAGKTRWIGHC